MPRLASGEEHLELARNAVRIAKTADELRSAQALLLSLELGLSLEQTAIAIGRSKGKTCTLRTNYCKRATGRMAASVAKRNLRNRANRSLEEEKALLQEVFDGAGAGGVLVVPPFADKLRQKWVSRFRFRPYTECLRAMVGVRLCPIPPTQKEIP